jgi:hypothetical protein
MARRRPLPPLPLLLLLLLLLLSCLLDGNDAQEGPRRHRRGRRRRPGPGSGPGVAPVAQHLRDGSPVLRPVCLLNAPPKRVVNPDPMLPPWNVSKKIVAFRASRSGFEEIQGNYGREAGFVTGQFKIEFRTGPPPNGTAMRNGTAFFVGATCEANIDHFLFDEYLPLFSAARQLKGALPATNATASEDQNYVFYHQDLHSFKRGIGPNGGRCHDPTRFAPLLEALGLGGEAQAFWGKGAVWGGRKRLGLGGEGETPFFPEVCFRRGVVVRGSPTPPRVAMDYVARRWAHRGLIPGGGSNDDDSSHQINNNNNNNNNNASSNSSFSSPSCRAGQATVIQRLSSRRILNLDAVLDVLARKRFPKVVVANFEAMSIPEQLHAVRSSAVLVGAFGAGLAWSGGLHPDAALVEFLWPDLPRRYLYSCEPRRSTFDTCRSRYGARAGYVYVRPGDTFDNPNASKGGRASKQKDIKINPRSLAQVLDQLFPKHQYKLCDSK